MTEPASTAPFQIVDEAPPASTRGADLPDDVVEAIDAMATSVTWKAATLDSHKPYGLSIETFANRIRGRHLDAEVKVRGANGKRYTASSPLPIKVYVRKAPADTAVDTAETDSE